MVYLDYSATTPVNEEVLSSFCEAARRFPGNPNSLHRLGVEANQMIERSTHQIASIMGVKEDEIIYTSGSSEANNLAVLGIAHRYQNRGRHIITTDLEHSSVREPIKSLIEEGYEVSIASLDDSGKVDIENLKSLIREDTILVSVCAVNSELGILEGIDEIGSLLKDYPKCYFHVDMTQAVGKVKVSLENVDLASFAAHKFYGLKGIGVLIKKEKIELTPMIYGGKSTTKYRSGTPALPLIVSMAKALRLATTDLDSKYEKVAEMNKTLRDFFSKYEYVHINSLKDAIPHILNISVVGVKPETMLHALEEKDVFISTQSACSSQHAESKAVLAVTKNKEFASSSLRISISYLTTKEEIDKLENAFDECYQRLIQLRSH